MLRRSLIPLTLCFLASCSAPLQRHEFTRICMGVPARIVLYAESPEIARNAAAAAYSRISEVEQALSDYRPDSEARQLCSHPVGVPVPVGHDLFNALRISRDVSEASDGAFDVTIGPATQLWREARRTGDPPTDDQVQGAQALIDCRSILLDEQFHTVTLTRPGIKLDFGGIGKGLGAQAAVDHLRSHHLPRCLVALAGDIALGDPPPHEPGWVVQLPLPDGSEGWGEGLGRSQSHDLANSPQRVIPVVPRTLTLHNAALSTSGDTEQAIEFNGRRLTHIIDPRTALGRADRRVVTVVAPRGEFADALSTAAWLLGPVDAPELLARFPKSTAIFIESADSPPIIKVLGPKGILD